MHALDDWSGIRRGGRAIGLGVVWPSEILDYIQMWSPYIEGTVASLKACAAAASDPAQGHQTSLNAYYLESSWHGYDSSSAETIVNNAPTILANLQRVLYMAGVFTQQAAPLCASVAWPAPAPLPHQSAVISVLQNVGYALAGELDLLAAGTGGVLVSVGNIAADIGGAALRVANAFSQPWPWVAITVVAGGLIAWQLWPRRG